MRSFAAVVLLTVLGGTTSAVRADEGEPPCLKDMQRLCPLVPDTGSYVQGCLEQYRDQLSAECRKNLGGATDNRERVRAACGSDTDRFCNNLELGGGQQVGCLIKHREALSSRCRDVLDAESEKK